MADDDDDDDDNITNLISKSSSAKSGQQRTSNCSRDSSTIDVEILRHSIVSGKPFK